eukprot:TRINITY_DN10366_c0_g1_i10.p1 TRINITY_DN10366_c0_g1~~TRINITY_DN10366_c0_g1_i10.p1  ORF type:complete len:262 (-),score=80.79 TRINITY_DN10366_c0_g1_i10:36-821(-)
MKITRHKNPLRGSHNLKENGHKIVLRNVFKESQDRPFRNITNLCCAHDSKKPKEPLISRSFTARQKENSTICLLEIKRTHPVRKTNPQLCEEYVEEIDGYLKRIEGMHKVDAEYMERQKEVNEYMRAVLVDWLVDVHIRFKLLSETLFLTVNIVDRYLEKERVKRDHLQLVGITACLIACKYEEIYPPEIKDFVYITNYTYTKEDILKLEQLILNSLQFNLNIPSSNRFLQRFSKSLGLSLIHICRCRRLLTCRSRWSPYH